MLSFIEPTSCRNTLASSSPVVVRDPCRSSRIAEMTRREVSAFALRVLNTSAAVTESEWGRQES